MNENKSGLCTAALVFGIISVATCLLFNLGFLPGVFGLIFSIICLAKKKEPRKRAKGGLITSIIGLVVGFITGGIGIVIIIISGMIVGGGIAGIGAIANSVKDGDFDNVVNVIDNIQDVNTTNSNNDLDYLSGLLNGNDNGNDYDDQFVINDNGGFDIIDPDNTYDGYDAVDDYWDDYDWDTLDWDQFYDDYSDNYDLDTGTGKIGDPGSYFMKLSNVYFEDLEEYGYTYSYGADDYAVYKNKNGAEFEFPAYVVPVSAFGKSNFDAYYNYIDALGVVDNEDGYYYDEKLYQWNSEWDYAYCERINDYGSYQSYEIWLFAFSDYSDDMVILIGRPTADHFDKDFDDFEKTLDYMTCNP